jgi:hypothetical protein
MEAMGHKIQRQQRQAVYGNESSGGKARDRFVSAKDRPIKGGSCSSAQS